MDRLSTARIDQIRARLANTTPGPWTTFDDRDGIPDRGGAYPLWRGVLGPTSTCEPIVSRCGGEGYTDSILNADFIAGARQDVPALLEDLAAANYEAIGLVRSKDALHGRIDRLAAALRELLSACDNVGPARLQRRVHGPRHEDVRLARKVVCWAGSGLEIFRHRLACEFTRVRSGEREACALLCEKLRADVQASVDAANLADADPDAGERGHSDQMELRALVARAWAFGTAKDAILARGEA